MQVQVWIPLTVGSITLLSIIGRILFKVYKIISRMEDTVPTLEKIAKQFPGKTLKRHLESIEHAIDLQSQEIQKLSSIVDRRKTPSPLGAFRPDGSWRPEGWEQGDRLPAPHSEEHRKLGP